MKKTITKIGMVMLICLTVLFTNSCKKKGCIDPDSTNYDSKAKEDDGSCQYKGSAVLWLSQSSSANAVSLGWTNLKICDGNGNVINNVSTSIYFNSNPGCGANGATTINKNMGSNKSLVYTVVFKVTTPYTVDSLVETDNITILANKCVDVSL